MGRKGENRKLFPSSPAQRPSGERRGGERDPTASHPSRLAAGMGGRRPAATPPGRVEVRLQRCPSQTAGPPPAGRKQPLPQPRARGRRSQAGTAGGRRAIFFLNERAPPSPGARSLSATPPDICIMRAAADGIGCWRAGSGVMSALAG